MNLHFSQVRSFCLLLLVLVAGSAVSIGQTQSGEMAGTITDTSGAVIPGAHVTATNQATSVKTEAVSTSSGSYRFTSLPVGAYDVTVSAASFGTATSTGVQVTINGVASLNVSLQAGATETVTVDASGLRLETESSDIGGTVSNKQIEDLPLSLASGVGGMRSPETFVFLLPGTGGPGTGTSGNTGNGVFFSRLSGGQAYGAEVLLDGASIQRSENGSSFDETSPSIEALQEFKVTTSTPSAEFGRTTAGIESFSVKSGTNSFHGTAYAIVKNRIFDGNNWFNDGYKVTDCAGISEVNCAYSKPKDSKYDYGGTFSGPVRIPKLYDGKDRTFFLFAWEKYQYYPGTVAQSTVPTAAERAGDFTAILGGPTGQTNPCTGDPILQNQIFDPSTSTELANGTFCRFPFSTNNIIPTSQFSAAAQKLIAGLPLPNQAPQTTDVDGFLNNYSFKSTAPNINTTYTIRIDQNISQNDKIFATYDSRDNFKLSGTNTFPEPFNNGSYNQDFETHYARAGWDHTFTPTILNHLNLGYNRTNSINFSAEIHSALTAGDAGIANENSTFYPIINFTGPDDFSSLGQQQNGDNVDNGIRIGDSVTWEKGRNSFKFGVDIRFQQYSVIDYNTNYLTFYRDQTAAANCCSQFLYDGNTFASFLLGDVGNGGQTVFNDRPRWNSHYLAGYFEDDMKFSKNLTLNLGLRYDVDVPRHEGENRTSNLSLTAPDSAAGGLPGALVFGVNCKCNTAWADTWKKDFAPRLGFAYVLPGTNDKAVIRGGFATIYGPLQYNDFGASMDAGYTQSRSVFANNGVGTAAAFTPAFQLDNGYPLTSFAPSLDPTQLTAPNGVGSFDAVAGELIQPKNGRPSMTSNWSLQLQQEIAQDLIFTIGYIGQVAQNLRSGDLTNINNISTSNFSLGDRLDDSQFVIPEGGSNSGVKAPYSTFAGNLGQALRPFPQYDYIAGDCCLENLGHSSYNAMLISVSRRFRNGFNLQASYTWAKTLTDADSTIPFSYVSGNQLAQGEGSANLKLNKAVSVQNIPHTLSLSYLYQFPFGKGRKFLNNNRALDLVVGGWQVGAIQRYESGQPIGFGCATGIPYYQNCIRFTAGAASTTKGGFATAAYQHNKNGPSVFNGQSWFKPAFRAPGTNGTDDPGVSLDQAGFVDQNREGVGWLRTASAGCADGCSFDPYSFGNIARVTEAVTGPLYLSEDVSLLKDFRLTEKTTFQLKGEAFDVLNRHRMALPDLAPGDSSGTLGFGIPGAVDYGPRNMQVSGRINF
jgi:hypothetical protein